MTLDALKEAVGYCLVRGLTFVAFRSNDGIHLWISKRAGLLDVSWAELTDHKKVFVVAPFDPGKAGCTVLEPAFIFGPGMVSFDPAVLEQAEGSSIPTPLRIAHWGKEDHARAIHSVQLRMYDGILEKVVLSRTKEIPFDRTKAAELFLIALKEQPNAFVCLLNCAEYGTWLGASPEMLVYATGERVVVDSIAGTLPINAAPSDAADWGAKEREEQDIVTRSVLNTFLNSGLKELSVTGPEVLSAGHVAHLHSKLRATLGDLPLAHLVKALHPTPAVCGTPKDAALEAIQDLEPHDRSLYAGFWGPWQCNGSTRLHVNIRCVQLLKDKAIIYVGGGITAGSITDKEWTETEHKALTWQRPLEALLPEIT